MFKTIAALVIVSLIGCDDMKDHATPIPHSTIAATAKYQPLPGSPPSVANEEAFNHPAQYDQWTIMRAKECANWRAEYNVMANKCGTPEVWCPNDIGLADAFGSYLNRTLVNSYASNGNTMTCSRFRSAIKTSNAFASRGMLAPIRPDGE